MSQITKRTNLIRGLNSGKPDERLLLVGDASSPSVRTLPITFFASKSNYKQEQAEEAMRGVVFTDERGLEPVRFAHPTPDAHDVVSRSRLPACVAATCINTAALDQAEEACEPVEKPVDGKGVFMM